ncbi:hypothetical protein F5888DRAFT_1774820 [Russula emetica]|nr:hypothetical protein F5888DRAFT_1774820 [Russula emetica]
MGGNGHETNRCTYIGSCAPAELARTRTKREHLENEIYLSLDVTSVVDNSAILAHCDVASTPRKSQKPASSRFKSHVSTMTYSFFCINAVDS